VFRLSLALFALLGLLAGGCRHCRTSCDDRKPLCERIRDRFDDRADGRRRDTGTDRDRAIPPGVIPPRGETIPATPLPVTPGRSERIEFDPTATLPPPKRSSEKLPVDLPPSSVPSDPVLTVPAPNRTLLLPDPLLQDPLKTAPAKSETSGILGDPILAEPAKSDLPPAGIEAFAAVPGQDNVASGKKPTLEGLDALKAKGFKTVLYIHGPDADVSAAKETVEKRGLKFVALSVSPQTLGDACKTFAEQLKDATSKPLFVYDLDGARAGSLWYLQFRKVEMLNDEVARIRAGALGLQDATDSELQKQFWLAIQEQLANR